MLAAPATAGSSLVVSTPVAGSMVYGGTATIDPNEIVNPIITARTNGSFTISLRRLFPAAPASTTSSAGTVRIGFLFSNPGK